MAFKSPGVYVNEYEVKTAHRQHAQIRAAFAGNFQKGPVGEALMITHKDELVRHFGIPTDVTYNDWYQVERFLRYYPGIYVTRAANLEHTFDACAQIDTDITVTVDTNYKSFEIDGANPFKLKAGQIKNLKNTFRQYDRFTIEGDNANNGAIYTVTDVESFSFEPRLKYDVFNGNQILRLSGVVNASVEMPTEEQFNRTSTAKPNGTPTNEPFIESSDAFHLYKDSFSVNNVQTPLVIWARSPGSWGSGIQVAIVKPEDFKVNYSAQDTKTAKLAFDGVVVDTAFRQAPHTNQIGVIVSLDNKVVEQFVVSPDPSGPAFIEDEINAKSAYIYVKRGVGPIWSTAFSQRDIKRPLVLLGGKDAEVSVDDLKNAYKIYEDKDTFKFDVIIGNELDRGIAAKNLAMDRQDIHSVYGADLSLFASRDTAKTVDNLVDWREHIFTVEGCACPASEVSESTINAQVYKSSFSVFVGNYGVIHDPYTNKKRMINLAGDIAGLRSRCNSEFGEWKACGGVNRGVLEDGLRLVFNPTLAQRDIMYAHNINPVIAMQGVGNVLWGNRTMDSLDSHFVSWHVRSLMNMLIRSCNETLRFYVMENVNPYTMHAVQASLAPLFNVVKAGGGLIDYRIICDHTNNNEETMANQELNVDLYIKPTGVAEFICVRLVNTGSESIAEVIQREQLRRA